MLPPDRSSTVQVKRARHFEEMGLGKPQGTERQLLATQDDEGKGKVKKGSISDTNSMTRQQNIKRTTSEQPITQEQQEHGQ